MLNKIEEILNSITPEQDLLYKKWNIQHRDEFFTQIYWSYHPETEKYFFEGNPAFSYEYKNIFDFGRYPITMLRDGFVGVLEFFLLHPIPPKDFKSVILIHKKYERLIPKSWKDQVACYEIQQREDTFERQNNFLFCYGTATEQLFWNQSVDELAQKLSTEVKKYSDFLLYLPIRDSHLSSSPQKKMHYLELLKELYRNIGFDIPIVHDSFDKILKRLETKNFDFLSMDTGKVFIADDYNSHVLFSLGGNQIVQKTYFEESDDLMVCNLSSNHCIKVGEAQLGNTLFPEFFVDFKFNGQKTRSIYEVFKDLSFQEKFRKYFC